MQIFFNSIFSVFIMFVFQKCKNHSVVRIRTAVRRLATPVPLSHALGRLGQLFVKRCRTRAMTATRQRDRSPRPGGDPPPRFVRSRGGGGQNDVNVRLASPAPVADNAQQRSSSADHVRREHVRFITTILLVRTKICIAHYTNMYMCVCVYVHEQDR